MTGSGVSLDFIQGMFENRKYYLHSLSDGPRAAGQIDDQCLAPYPGDPS